MLRGVEGPGAGVPGSCDVTGGTGSGAGAGGRTGPTENGGGPGVRGGGGGIGVVGTGGVTGSARTSMRVGDDGAAAGAFAPRPGDVALHAVSESVASSTDAVSP